MALDAWFGRGARPAPDSQDGDSSGGAPQSRLDRAIKNLPGYEDYEKGGLPAAYFMRPEFTKELPEKLDGPTLLFKDGNLIRYDENGRYVDYYPATSGKDGTVDPTVPNRGPIPPGDYMINPRKIHKQKWYERNDPTNGDWGRYKTPLTPSTNTDTFGRTGFYLHGGDRPGSAGCIDIGQGDGILLPDLVKEQGPIRVIVR